MKIPNNGRQNGNGLSELLDGSGCFQIWDKDAFADSTEKIAQAAKLSGTSSDFIPDEINELK